MNAVVLPADFLLRLVAGLSGLLLRPAR